MSQKTEVEWDLNQSLIRYAGSMFTQSERDLITDWVLAEWEEIFNILMALKGNQISLEDLLAEEEPDDAS
jgi:hypothetical protein